MEHTNPIPIQFFASQWGNTLPFAVFCRAVQAAGYDGVEMALPLDPVERRDVTDTLKDYGLTLIGQSPRITAR